MDFENSSLNSFYTTNDQDNHFKCDICTLIFRTPCERNEHILNHLRRTTCSLCDETLIQIGDIWYSPHQHTNQTIIKNEVIPDDVAECLIKPLIYTESGVENIDPLHAKQEISYEDENIDENIIEKIAPNLDETEYQSETEIFAETVDRKPIDIFDIPNYDEEEQSEEAKGKKPFGICGVCGKHLSCSTSFKYHMNIHLGVRPFECEFCDKKFTDKRNRNKHQTLHRKHSGKSEPTITRNTNEKWAYPTEKNYYMCKLCRVAFLHKDDLLKHEMSNCEVITTTEIPNTDSNQTKGEEKGIQCEICKKEFARMESLRSHMNIHLGLKPYRCEICNRSWTHKANLNTHRGSYPNKDCNLEPENDENDENDDLAKDHDETSESTDAHKSSLDTADEDVDMGDLTDHDETDGESRGIIKKSRRVACSVCKKVFRCEASLKYHMNLHLGIRPFKCNVCDHSFSDKRNIKAHLRTHERFEHSDWNRLNDIEITACWNDRNLTISPVELFNRSSCPLCDKHFQYKRSVKMHFRAHKEFRFICKICRASHLSLDSCLDHLSRTHTEKSLPTPSCEKDSDNKNISIDWLCEYCNKVFEIEMFLARHILQHHSNDKQEHQCNFCTIKFGDLNDLLPHMRAHSENNEHKCSFDGCGQSFAYKSILATHLSKHNLNNEPIIRKTQDDLTKLAKQRAMISVKGKCDDTSLVDDALTCKFCRTKCKNLTKLRIHIRNVHATTEPIICTIESCDKTFKNITGLQMHIKTYHPRELKKCDECSKCFISESELAEHRKIKHEIMFTCNICSEKFIYKHYLRRHVTKEHEEESTCTICNEKFHSVRAMLDHHQRHGGITVFSCKFKGCKEKFDDHQSLALHSMQHLKSEKPRLVCPICGKQVCRSGYNDHMNSHTGTTPHTCKDCGKSFSQQSSLLRHNLIHTGRKPYICNIDGCVHAFRDWTALKRHKFRIHKFYTKKHTCTICSKVFPENRILTKHMKSVHGISDSSKLSA